MTINHYTGPLTETNDYTPWGLITKMLSSKAFGKIENKYKYNGYEQNETFDLNLYESFYRTHDPQLGRFWQVDPKPTDFESLYAAMGNNPCRNFDILGDSIGVGNLYAKDENGRYLYRSQILAFELFIMTKEGKQYIQEHAQKGFKLDGILIDIEVKKEGKMSKKGIDVSYAATNGPLVFNGILANGLTQDKIDGGRLKIDITLAKYRVPGKVGSDETRDAVLKGVNVVSHETFLHADLLEKRFVSGSKLNPYQHSNFLASKYGGEGKGIQNSYALSILRQVQSLDNKLNRGLSPHSDNWLLGKIIYPSVDYLVPGWTPQY
jgi:RHS repeat-associated protein